MRFYISPDSVFPEKNIIEINDRQELHHIRNVMRLKKGERVNVFDGIGKEYSGNIKEIGRDSVVIGIEKSMDSGIGLSFRATLYQAIPKRSRMDFIVEKVVELGIDRVVPIITERTVAAIKKKESRKIERWLRIARSASKQCGRIRLPTMSDVVHFDGALDESKKNDLVVFATLDKDARSLREILKGSHPKNIAVFVGPEGDFSQKEIAMAKKQGYAICSLGQSVLRVDTAAIYILSCLNYEYAQA